MMNALILGLLISTAKSSYDAKRTELTQMAANAILVDRSLAMYGSETKEVRGALRDLLVDLIDQIQSIRGGRYKPESAASAPGAKRFYQLVRRLSPRDDGQKSLKAEVLRASFEVAQIRAVALAQESNSIPMPFLFVLTFWLVVLFTGYGLFAPLNPTVVIALSICSFSISAAVFMILAMDQPFSGSMDISIEPLINAISVVNR